jgi:hypothetical protein
MTLTETAPALPDQPLATVKLNSTLMWALAGRGDDMSRLAAEAMVALAQTLEDRGHRLTAEWCTATYLGMHAPLRRAALLAPPKTPKRTRKGATS